jgi:D-arginine utilization repressor
VPVKTPVPGWLEPHLPLCEAIAALFAPLVEIAAHDVRRDRIVGLWNPVSGRRLGDRSRVDQLPPYSDADRVVGPCAKAPADGRAVTSVSVVLRNAKGAPRGLLCIDFDRSPLDGVIDLLARFAAPLEDRPSDVFDGGWHEQIVLVVDEECRSRHLRRERLAREERLELVRGLDGRGLFSTRNAALHAARALGVSRTTVYALLKEARS